MPSHITAGNVTTESIPAATRQGPERNGSARHVEADVRRVADWLQDEVDGIVDVVCDRLREEVPEYFDGIDPVMEELRRASVAANALALADGLRHGRSLANRIPPAAMEEVLSAANEGIPWIAVLQTYQVGHACCWELMSDEIEGWGLSDAVRRELLRVASRYQFGYMEKLTRELANIYQEERDRVLRSQERRRTALIRELLAGMPVSEDQLGYRLSVDHIGVVAWGRQPEKAVKELAQALNCACLMTPGAGRSIWAWLGGMMRIDTRAASLLGQFTPPDATFLAVGDAACGVDGFAESHRQALLAYRVAVITGRPIVQYDDIAVEALVVQDERLARRFAERALGPLATPDARTATLRETLRAYFSLGQNASAAGALLGVNDRTVAYRLSTIEDRLGYPITRRRDELALALRIHDLFEPYAGRPDTG